MQGNLVLRRARRRAQHDEHPAFLEVIQSMTDTTTGLCVEQVRYKTDHPDYQGGVFWEVYDCNDDCVLDWEHEGGFISQAMKAAKEHLEL